MSLDTLPFSEVWCADFEFRAPDGERPQPHCMVARELRSGRLIRRWADELGASAAPFDVSADSLFVSYYASAELGCFLALGWGMPSRILDLCAEFKLVTSGLTVTCGRSLLGALTHYGLDGLDAVEKESMRALAMRGGEYSSEERQALLDYCQSDVDALARLLPRMLPAIDLPRALLRGRYMAAAARIEWTGTPIDTDTLATLRDGWTGIQDRLIATVDADYGVYEGRTFRHDRWAAWLERNGVPWPRLASGALDLSRDAFHEMGRSDPRIAAIGELRHSLSELRLNDLAVGSDGRNRTLLGAFGSRTGRNQPSNSRFIFGPATWLRSLIKPGPGKAVAYLDYEQQEFGIAAALSGDVAMQEAYRSGDPYLKFAQQAGAAPADATKDSHRFIRERFKVTSLAVQYGMQAESLARRLGESTARARELLHLHRDTYPQYWRWSDAVEMQAMLSGSLRTVFGWRVHTGTDVNPRSLRNFPLQANGAEILRLACCLVTEAGIDVCAPVHDALLIEADADRIDAVVEECQGYMRRAAELALDGFALRTEAAIVRYPDRYSDPRGVRMWTTVNRLLAENLSERQRHIRCCAGAPPVQSYVLLHIGGYPPHDQNRSGSAADSTDDARTADTQQTTATAPTAGEVPERSDPMEVAGASRGAAWQGAARLPVSLARKRLPETADGPVLFPVVEGNGHEPLCRATCNPFLGIGETGDGGAEDGTGAAGDHLGREVVNLLAAVVDPGTRADVEYAYRERLAICVEDGGLTAAEAEPIACAYAVAESGGDK